MSNQEKKEATIEKSRRKTSHIWLAWIVISLVIILVIVPRVQAQRKSAYENRCKLTLRALASSQLAYLEGHIICRDYGSWGMDKYSTQKRYDNSNLIDNYTIVVFNVTKPTLDENGRSNRDSTIEIIAIPNRPKYKLRTFAISEGQIPLLWIGNSNDWTTEDVKLHDTTLWEPLR